jgi:hypothetical protein
MESEGGGGGGKSNTNFFGEIRFLYLPQSNKSHFRHLEFKAARAVMRAIDRRDIASRVADKIASEKREFW